MNREMPNLRPVSTLFGAPVSDIEDLGVGDVAAVGVYCDHFSAGGPGGRFAARQLRYASTISNPSASRHVVDLGDFNVFPLEPERTQDILCEQSERIVARGAKLFALGGDYSLTPALISGVTSNHKTKSIGLARISRRLDSLPVGMKPSGGPWRRSATSEISDLLPAGSAAITLVGVRGDMAMEERRAMSQMVVIPAAAIASNPAASARRARRALEAVADHFYLSVDADVLAPHFGSVALPRTRGGLSLEQLMAVLDVFEDTPLVGADLTGHLPDLDVPGRMATTLISSVATKILSCLRAER